MISLPDRYAYLPLPPEGKDGELTDLARREEAASLWLWGRPRLLGWKKTVNWLFSSVVGNTRYPGDLWGIDGSGDLIVVETKIDWNRGSSNPFEDFVRYDQEELWHASILRDRWQGLIQEEKRFISEVLPALDRETPLGGCHRGVVPYSRHRLVVCQWQNLYRRLIVPRITSGSYERAVARGLRCRERGGNSPPVFFGLIASVRPKAPVLSKAGRRDLHDLQKMVGEERVCLRAIRLTKGVKKLRLHSWSL